MPLTILDLLGAKPSVSGEISRRMLELRPNLFVGNLSKRAINDLWSLVEESHPRAALLVYPAKNEIGFNLLSFGDHRFTVIDHFGIPLVKVKPLAIAALHDNALKRKK